jgi:hypothetical protein
MAGHLLSSGGYEAEPTTVVETIATPLGRDLFPRCRQGEFGKNGNG